MTRSRLPALLTALVGIIVALATTPSCSSDVAVFSVTGGGSSVGGGGEGGAGGGEDCTEANDCPGVDSDCRTRACDAGTCSFTNAPLGTVCDDDGGKSCDGDGSCVECVTASDCDGMGEQCVQQQCVPAQCVNGVQDGDETDVDCGGAVCAPCDDGQGCQNDVDCVSAFCDDGTCAPCATDLDCAVTFTFCDEGTCTPQKGPGEICGGGNECVSGFCADGVCCDSTCASTCESCLGANTNADNGTCALVIGGTDPDGECVASPVATCGANGTGCSGTSNACNLYPGGTQCQPGFCANAVQSAPSQCNGNGQCNPGPGLPCAPFGCNAAGTSCASSCSNFEPCAPGFVCQGGNCVPPLPNGQPCNLGSECQSGSCVDNVCCNTPCNGQCQACVQSKTGSSDGTCAPVSAGTDPDTECTDTGGPCGSNGTGCNGLSLSPGCNGYTCSCGQQYTHPNVFEVCPLVSPGQCGLRVSTVGASCDTICAQGGGECLSAVNDNPNGTCNPSGQTLSCAQQGFGSMICTCSSGCGAHASCSMPLTCGGGICQ